MLSNAPANGLELLSLMAAKAAECASAQLFGSIRLAKCDGLELAEGFMAEEVDLESWAVRANEQNAVIAVFATAPQDDGGRRMAASARFTFAALPRERRHRA
jgi:acyl-CoA hydrolase